MIIVENHGLAFVHIPKCAGTTVREQLVKLDDTASQFAGVQTHPQLGRIDYMHLPLGVLAQYFPDTFGALTRLDVYAITRDPQARFQSSVSEYLKRIQNRRMAELSSADLQSVVEEVMRKLENAPEVFPYEIAHFTPQCAYIFYQNRQIAQHTFALDHIEALFAVLAARAGVDIDTKAWSNQDFVLRFEGLKKSIWGANDIARSLLPYRGYQALKRIVRPVLVRNRSTPVAKELFASDKIKAFVRDYYAEDFRQYAADLNKELSQPGLPHAAGL